jgi:hypothetical protein
MSETSSNEFSTDINRWNMWTKGRGQLVETLIPSSKRDKETSRDAFLLLFVLSFQPPTWDRRSSPNLIQLDAQISLRCSDRPYSEKSLSIDMNVENAR